MSLGISVMRKRLLWATLLIPLLISLTVLNTTKAGASTTVSVDPPVIWDPNMGPGTVFMINIVVDYIYKLAAYQIELGEADFEIPGWDPSVLNLLEVLDGGFLGSEGGTVKFWPGDIDNDLGALTLSVGVLDPAERFPTGGGALVTLIFLVVGYGSTPISYGLDSGLLNSTKHWVVRGTMNPEALKGGFFSNLPGPELEMPHGCSGVWEEHQTILVGETQTSYAMVRNWGSIGAWVEVDFVVIGPDGTKSYRSNQAWVGPRIRVGNKRPPGEVVVSADYVPGSPGHYWAYAVLYFKAGEMTEKVPYAFVEATLGGEAQTRPTNTAFSVKTH